MFDKPYRDAARGMYFPVEQDDAIERRARRDALMVLKDAAERCWEQDMRTGEVRAALEYLRSELTLPGAFDRFWRALHDPNVIERRRLALAELRAIVRSCPTHNA